MGAIERVDWRVVLPDLSAAMVEGSNDSPNYQQAYEDPYKGVLASVDFLNDFAQPDGNLTAPNGMKATLQTVKMIHQAPEAFSAVLAFLEMHERVNGWKKGAQRGVHIFWPEWWISEDGRHPEPFTEMLKELVLGGALKPLYRPDWSKFYVEELERTKQPPLRIWWHHCLAGTRGADMVNELAEALAWLHAACLTQVRKEYKGLILETEHYGGFGPCVPVPNHSMGVFRSDLLIWLAQFRKAYYTGLYADFCLGQTVWQAINFYRENGMDDAIKRMVVLTDCTALVIEDNRARVNSMYVQWERMGVKITTSKEEFGLD